MAAYYDKQILDLVAASDHPLRHSEIAERIAPNNNAAWNQIGMSLTQLYRRGLLAREKSDGRYYHYSTGDGVVMTEVERLRAERDQAWAEVAALRSAIQRYQTECETPPPFDDPDLRLIARRELFAVARADAGAHVLALLSAARAVTTAWQDEGEFTPFEDELEELKAAVEAIK